MQPTDQKNTLTPEQVAEIRAREQAATPGPWQACNMVHHERGDQMTPEEIGEYVAASIRKSKEDGGFDHFLFLSTVEDEPRDICHIGNGPNGPLNARFLESARTDIPALCDTVDALRGAMKAQDERERLAGEQCGVPYELHGCDWPQGVAEAVLSLRAELVAMRVECVDPKAPIVKCAHCEADIHTCERKKPFGGWDYRCPVHPDGVELSDHRWVCSLGCGDALNLAAELAAMTQRAEAAEKRLNGEYICECGLRVEPHRCRNTEGSF